MVEESIMRFVKDIFFNDRVTLVFEDSVGNIKEFHLDQQHWMDEYIEQGMLVKGKIYILQCEGGMLMEINKIVQETTTTGQVYMLIGVFLMLLGTAFFTIIYPIWFLILNGSSEVWDIWMTYNFEPLVITIVLVFMGIIISISGLYLVYGKND